MSVHRLRIFSGSANRPLAASVAHHLGIELGDVKTTRLPDSEIHVQVNEAVRDQDIFIIQPCSAPVNDNLMELLLYIDAFRRASAHSITAVMPYFPYARQERMSRGREAISAKVVANLLERVGASRVIFVDIHARATQGFFDIPVDPISAVPILAEYFHGCNIPNAVVVSPDVGRAKLAARYAELIGAPLAMMYKRRTSFDTVETTQVIGEVEGKTPIVIDDIIAGGSVLTQLPTLIEAGARPEVYLAISHAVLLSSALERLNSPLIRELVVTDTIALPPEKQHPKIRVLPIGQLLAEVIQRIYSGMSISSLLVVGPDM